MSVEGLQEHPASAAHVEQGTVIPGSQGRQQQVDGLRFARLQ